MSKSDSFREGEQTAIAWIERRSPMLDDLAILVAGMKGTIGEYERGFLVTIGNAAREAARREGRTAAAPAQSPRLRPRIRPSRSLTDVDETGRRHRQRALRDRLHELGRRNAQAWLRCNTRSGGWGGPRRDDDRW
ncbi:MAG TPA: hypothetical protein VGG79_13525 [Roseiarcus sp.]|jgi:hypothetical protein